jgi:5-methylcytosine-specific restriction endonuclease McrA
MVSKPRITAVTYAYDSKYANKTSPYRNVEHADWSTLVKKRDKYTCVICHVIDNLHAHHLESYIANEDMRYDIKNGVTLCGWCHRKFHKKYGLKNFDASDFEEFYNVERNSID